MKKEEFLAMSLPYGLHCIVSGDATFKILSLHFENINLVRIHKTGYRDFPMTIPHIKPILRPLSDLTKPIEHNGETFVPIERIKELFIEGTEDVLSQSIEAIEYFIENNFFSRIEYLPFILIQKLIEWHFAVGLDENDYIDVNTLEVTPYK